MTKSARRPRVSSAVQTRSESKVGRPGILIAVALAVLTLSIYAPVVGHQFINLDDSLYIVENPMVNRGLTLAGLAWAFTTFHAANWHPLTWISHMIDSQIFGMNAGGHLFVNTLIHTANTLLVFLLLLRATDFRWRSALVAALFAVHPLHVESIAWAAERKDTLATLFGLLSLIAYCRYARFGSRRQYVWSALVLAFGLMAKPMLVTWPFVMLLLDYWPLRRYQRSEVGSQNSLIRDLIVEKIPFFIIAAASAAITVIAQSRGGAVRDFVDAPVWLRLSNAVVSYAKYLMLTFWPNKLAVYYPFSLAGIPGWQIVAAAALLIAISVFCVANAKHRPYLLVGWFWFLGTLVPVIGLFQVGGQTMADRYHYIPSIGLFTALIFGLADITPVRKLAPTLKTICAAVPILAFVGLTSIQIRLWRDSTTLFRHTLAVTPPNMIIEQNFGLVLARSGQLDEAATHFEKALHVRSDFYDALINMGITRSQQRRLVEAVPYFQRAANIQPTSAKPHLELGLTYANLNQDQTAMEELQQAVRIEPQNSEARAGLGLVLLRLRKLNDAAEQLNKALRLDPTNADAHNNLGFALLLSGRVPESIPEFETALRLKPTLQIARDNLLRAQSQLGAQR